MRRRVCPWWAEPSTAFLRAQMLDALQQSQPLFLARPRRVNSSNHAQHRRRYRPPATTKTHAALAGRPQNNACAKAGGTVKRMTTARLPSKPAQNTSRLSAGKSSRPKSSGSCPAPNQPSANAASAQFAHRPASFRMPASNDQWCTPASGAWVGRTHCLCPPSHTALGHYQPTITV